MPLAQKICPLLILITAIISLWFISVGVRAQTPPYSSCVGFASNIGSTCALYAQATDPEGDLIYYIYTWGDGTADTRVPATGTVESGTEVYANHTWNSAGQFTIYVYAYDEADHQSTAAGPVMVTITTDTTGPTIDYTPNGSGGWQSTATTVTLSATDSQGVAQSRYNWDAPASQSVGTVYTNNQTINSPSGSHNLYLWARDTVGNQSSKGPSNPYQYDDASPTIPGQPNCTPNPNNTGSHSCAWTASTDTQSGLAGYYIYQSLNGGAFQLASPPASAANSWTPSPALASGTYKYRLVAYDNVGRISSSSPDSVDIVVDKTSPTVPTCNPGSGTYSSAQDVNCSASDAGSPTTTVTVRYTLTTPPASPTDPTCSSSAFINSTNINTPTTIKVIACDAAGNYSGVNTYNYIIIINPPPEEPYNPLPEDGGYTPAAPNFSWYGGDSDSVTYRVFISPDATISDPADYDGSTTVIGGTQYIPYGPPQSKVLNPGTRYWWQVWADDTPPEEPTYPGRPVLSPVRSFTVNNIPQTTGGEINPTAVNKQATITWQASDNNNDQVLTFNIYFNTVPQSLTGATKINSTPLTTSTNCTGTQNSTGWSCTYNWDTTCVPAAPELYVIIEVDDGYDSVSQGSLDLFSINHSEVKQFPIDGGFNQANNGDIVDFPIDVGSIDTTAPPQVVFKGVCTSPKTVKPSLQANTAPQVAYSGSLTVGAESEPLNFTGLIPGVVNKLKFEVEGCGQTGYRITYNLIAACGQPYVSVEGGTIYSRGDIRSEYAPPSGSFNTTYLILGGGSQAQSKRIENFISAGSGWLGSPDIAPQADYIRPNFGLVPYPSPTASSVPAVGAFDYYGLTHQPSGSLVTDGDSNIYGYQVKIWGEPGETIMASNSLNQGSNEQLRNRVYYFKGNLRIDEAVTFRNGSGNNRGAGLIIIDGDLYIDNDLSYEAGTYGDNIRNIASVGWMVRGNVEIGDNVSQIVGAFYAAGSQSGGGIFSTGAGLTQLNIYGPLIARKINFSRSFSTAGEPSEKVIMDGRVMINTPPGFTDLLRTLPAWRFYVP